jgi:hypothetical protein
MFLGLLLTSSVLSACFQSTFDGGVLGGLPSGWDSRGRDSSHSTYQVKVEPNGNRYLAAESRQSDVQIGAELLAVKAEDCPVLSWRWRVFELPKAANERNRKTLDSAAAVYAVFGSKFFPRILKYVWSSSAPAGSSFKHPSSGRMNIIVLNSGPTSLGQWHQIHRNLVEDYKAAFGSTPGNLIAIGVKTDSDSTNSSARADYDDILLSR